MKKKRILILFFLLFFICSVFAEDIILKKLKKIAPEGKGEIYKCIDLTTDELGNIYITDMLDYSIKKYNRNGDFIKKTGKKGEGPGEFHSPGLIDYYQGKIYVSQQMYPKIQIFNKNLNYINTIPLQTFVWCLEIFDNKLFVTSASILSAVNNSGVFQIKDNGKFMINSGEIKNDVKKNNIPDFLYRFKKFTIDKRGNYYIVNNYINKIEKYNKRDRKIWETALDFLNVKRAKKNKKGLPDKIIFKSIQLDNEGFIYILGGRYSKNSSRDIYILDIDGYHIKTLTLNESSNYIHIDKDNKLYSRGDMGCAINVYKIIKKRMLNENK